MNTNLQKNKFFDSGFEDADRYADIQGLVVSLETQQDLPGLKDARDEIFDEIKLNQQDSLLEIGCGLGATSRRLAALCPMSNIVAIDKSKALLHQARVRSSQYEQVKYEEGDVNFLQYPNNSFSLVFTERVLMHIKDPLLALSEMVRVLKPGGKIAIIEPDLTSVKFYPNTHNLSQMLASKWCEFTESPTIGVDLAKYLQKLNMKNIKIKAHTVLVRDLDELNRIRNINKLIVALVGEGQVNSKEAEEYQQNLIRAQSEGSFMYYVTVFRVIAEK